MVLCLGRAVRRPPVSRRSRSSSCAASPPSPSTPTRAAASSIARGMPSSLRQISATSGASPSVSWNPSRLAAACSTKSWTDGVAQRFRGPDAARRGRRLQRRQPAEVLALGAERLAAGREDADVRRAPEDRGDQRGGGVDDVHAVVEHQQHPPAAQRRDEVLRRQPGADLEADGRGDRAAHLARIRDPRQVDRPRRRPRRHRSPVRPRQAPRTSCRSRPARRS